MLTDRQRTLVRQSWAEIVPIAPTAAALFYARLFELAPRLRPLFRHAAMDAQGDKLTQVLGFAVAHLDRLDTLAPAVEALGRRHAGYGVEDRDYAVVGEALRWTLACGLGPAFTAEVEAAWTTTFHLLAGIMRSAVAGAAAHAGPPAAVRTDAGAARTAGTGAARALPTAVAALLALAAAARPAAAQTIDTRNATLGAAFTTLRFGQTFTVPVGATSLERFAFFLTRTGDGGGAAPAGRALVHAWDGTRAVGPAPGRRALQRWPPAQRSAPPRRARVRRAPPPR